VNGPVLILDTKGLTRGNNYTIGCELHNDIVFLEKKTTAMAKVNLYEYTTIQVLIRFSIHLQLYQKLMSTHKYLVLLIFFISKHIL